MAVWSKTNLSQLPAFRLDSEYYKPEYTEMHALLMQAGAIPISEFAYVTDGIHASPDWVEEGGVRYLSAMCVKNNEILPDAAGQISEAQNHANPRTQARLNDVLLTSVGTIGNAAVVERDTLPANMDRHLGIIRINDLDEVDPYYLSTFLNSSFGKFQSLRESTGNVQLNLFVDKINQILVPIGDQYNRIGGLVQRAYAERLNSKQLCIDAENLILDCLRLQLPHDNQHLSAYVGSFSEVDKAQRLDAEYYHPEKEYILKQLDLLPGAVVADHFSSVRNLVNPSTEGHAEELVYNYDLTDALRFFLDQDVDPVSLSELGSTKKRIQFDDVVVSRLRSYLKEIAIVRNNGNVASVGSSEFIVLRNKSYKFTPELLAVYLRSPYVQLILKWSQNGSNHPRFEENELLQLKVPDKLGDIQDEITKMIQDAVGLHQNAQQIFEQAMSDIEKLIYDRSR